MSSAPEISVIIPTYNRAKSLTKTLEALSHQTLSSEQYEVIVVDDCSTDDTERSVSDFVSAHSGMCLRYERHHTNRFRAAACNTGAKIARGDVIVFTDDDIRPVPEWLEAHLSRHRLEKTVVSVTGLVLYPTEWEKQSNWVRFANANYRKNEILEQNGRLPPQRLAGGNTSLCRQVFIMVGMFDERRRRGQDGDLAWRLYLKGIPLVYESKALVYHYSEIILSIEQTLGSFRRFYEYDYRSIYARYPAFLQKYGHWFLSPIDSRYDNFARVLAKLIVRIIARRSVQSLMIRVAQVTDRYPLLYWRPLYQYILVCEAMDAIRASYKRCND